MTDRVDIIVREDGSLAVRKRFDDLGTSADKAGKSVSAFQNVLSALRPIIGALGMGFIIQQMFQFADTATHLQNQLKLVVPTMGALEDVYQQLFEISQETTTNFADNVNMFSQLHRQAKVFGATAQDTTDVTNTLAQAMNAMGGSGSEAEGATKALVKAFATGEVSGRAFMGLLNTMPLVLEAIAVNLGRTPAELKRMGESGQLSGKMLFDALKKSDLIAQASAQKLDTLADGWGNIKNAAVKYFGEVNSGSGITQVLIQSMIILANHLGTILNILGIAITTWVSYRAAILLAGVAHSIYSVAALMSAASTTTAATATGLMAIGLRAMSIAAGIATLSISVLAGVVGAFFAIIRAHPFVAIVTILGLVISAIFAFGNSIRINSSGSITLLGALRGAFSLVAQGISILLEWGRQFSTWLVTTDSGLKVLAASAAFLAVVLYRQLATMITTILIPAMAALLAAVVRVTIAMGAQLLTPLGLAVSGFIAGAVAVAYFTGALEKVVEEAGKIATAITQKVVKAMEESTGAAKRTGAANTGLAGGMNELSGDGGPLKKLKSGFDDVSTSMNVYGNSAATSLDKARESIKEQERAVEELAGKTRNAFGDMIDVTDEWARRSGVYFNQVKEGMNSIAETSEVTFDRVASASDRATASVSELNNSIQSFSGASDMRFSGLPPGAAAEMSRLGIDVGEFMRVAGGWATHQGTPGGFRAQREFRDFFDRLSPSQKASMDFMGMGFQHGTDFMVPGSGSGDRTPIRFMAEPGERVRVTSRADQRRGGDQKTVVNNFHMPTTIVTPDANSFRESETQMINKLAARLSRVMSGPAV